MAKFSFVPAIYSVVLMGLFWNFKKQPKPGSNKIFSGYYISNCKNIIVTNEKLMHEYAYSKGKEYVNGGKLIEALFSDCYSKLIVNETNTKNAFDLFLYAIAGAYSVKKLTMKASLAILNDLLTEYKSKEIFLNDIDAFTIEDIVTKMIKPS